MEMEGVESKYGESKKKDCGYVMVMVQNLSV